jgi:hypothetical protein
MGLPLDPAQGGVGQMQLQEQAADNALRSVVVA